MPEVKVHGSKVTDAFAPAASPETDFVLVYPPGLMALFILKLEIPVPALNTLFFKVTVVEL